MDVIVRAVTVGMGMCVILDKYRQEAHLRSQHPAADPDDEDPGADGEICVDSSRDKPSGAECRENRDEDNTARVLQSVLPCPGVAAWTVPGQKLVRR